MSATSDVLASELDSELRRRVLRINHAFCGLPSLIVSAKHLSINAEIASSHVGKRGDSFVTVVKDLRKMAAQLEEMVRDLEEMFRGMVYHVARWSQAEHSARLFERAVKETARLCADNKGVSSVFEVARQNKRKQVKDSRASMLEAIDHLQSRIARIMNVASRQSQYLAITARIEAVNSGGKLNVVAADIRILSDAIASIAREANSQVLDLLHLVQRIQQRQQAAPI